MGIAEFLYQVILCVCSASICSGSNQVQLAVLHTKSVSVFALSKKDGAVEHGLHKLITICTLNTAITQFFRNTKLTPTHLRTQTTQERLQFFGRPFRGLPQSRFSLRAIPRRSIVVLRTGKLQFLLLPAGFSHPRSDLLPF